jgi:hypothetical protein
MIYLLTALGLSPGGSTHLHTNNTQNNTSNNRTTQITNNVEEFGPCPFFASFTLAFALQLRKKHGEPSVRVRKTSVRLINTSVSIQYTYYQNTHTLQSPHIHTNTHALQKNINHHSTMGAYREMVGKPEGKRPLGRPRRRWGDNIKIG